MAGDSGKKLVKFGKCVGVGLLLGALALNVGCRRSRTFTGPEGEKTTVTQKGDSVDVTFKGKEGEEVQVSGGGSGVALPDGFPKDVAIYPKATVFASTKDKKGAMSVVLKIADPAQKVGAFYQEKLKESGWGIENTVNLGNMTMLECTKDGRKLAVSINKDSEQTMATLVLQKED